MFKQEQFFFLFVVVKLKTINCEMEGYIVGGTKSKIEDFPHSVYLHVRCGSPWICGASILNQRLLLTAAHCVYNSNEKSYCKVGTNKVSIQSYIGHEDLKKVKITRGAVDLIVHKEYEDNTVENDVSVVLLNDTIPFSNTAKRIIIRTQWSLEIQNGFVAGWGIVNETTQMPALILKSVVQNIESQQTCAIIGELSLGMFCAGSTIAEDPHAALGDSGSAFVTKDVHQIGIVSFRVKSYPALMVYTNVTYYYKWIEEKSEELYCRNT